MAAPPNFHCYFGHSSSYFPGARQPPGAAGEAARRGDTQRRAHGRGAGPTPARGGRRRGAGSEGRRGAGETGRGASATCPHLCTASPRPPPPSSRLCLRLTFPAAAAAAGEGRGGRRRGGVMRKHDGEPSERRAPPAPSRAQPRRSRPEAASGERRPCARTCPAAPARRERRPTASRPIPALAGPAAGDLPPRPSQQRSAGRRGGFVRGASHRPGLLGSLVRPRRSSRAPPPWPWGRGAGAGAEPGGDGAGAAAAPASTTPAWDRAGCAQPAPAVSTVSNRGAERGTSQHGLGDRRFCGSSFTGRQRFAGFRVFSLSEEDGVAVETRGDREKLSS